jgi:hypothetical protein
MCYVNYGTDLAKIISKAILDGIYDTREELCRHSRDGTLTSVSSVRLPACCRMRFSGAVSPQWAAFGQHIRTTCSISWLREDRGYHFLDRAAEIIATSQSLEQSIIQHSLRLS